MGLMNMDLQVGDNLYLNDIPTTYYSDGAITSFQLRTPNGDYIELYEDGTWEFFRPDKEE